MSSPFTPYRQRDSDDAIPYWATPVKPRAGDAEAAGVFDPTPIQWHAGDAEAAGVFDPTPIQWHAGDAEAAGAFDPMPLQQRADESDTTSPLNPTSLMNTSLSIGAPGDDPQSPNSPPPAQESLRLPDWISDEDIDLLLSSETFKYVVQANADLREKNSKLNEKNRKLKKKNSKLKKKKNASKQEDITLNAEIATSEDNQSPPPTDDLQATKDELEEAQLKLKKVSKSRKKYKARAATNQDQLEAARINIAKQANDLNLSNSDHRQLDLEFKNYRKTAFANEKQWKDRLNASKRTIKSQNAKIRQLKSDLDKADSSCTSQAEKISGLEEARDADRGRITRLEDSERLLNEGVLERDNKIANLTATVETATEQAQRLADYEKKTKTLETEVDARDTKIGQLEDSLAHVKASLANSENKTETLETELDARDAKIEELQTKVAHVQGAQKKLSKKCHGLKYTADHFRLQLRYQSEAEVARIQSDKASVESMKSDHEKQMQLQASDHQQQMQRQASAYEQHIRVMASDFERRFNNLQMQANSVVDELQVKLQEKTGPLCVIECVKYRPIGIGKRPLPLRRREERALKKRCANGLQNDVRSTPS